MITEQERQFILNEMQKLLDEYDYNYTLHALNKIIDTWANKKANLIEAFKRHPNYVEGKFLIAFDINYDRDIDLKGVVRFSMYLDRKMEEIIDKVPDDIKRQREKEGCCFLPDRLFRFLVEHMHRCINSRTISEETANILEQIIPQIHPHSGEKSSRVINRICKYLKFNECSDYNQEFAKFADSLSPITIRRHTVLSINPLDYLTMSFGNSWASCHTIDKNNKRGMPNDYSGCYSSGTISYMLDSSSMVFYTVDSSYNGSDYWTQPKINRQMFHYGKEKLVQGRLYPQDNDDDDNAYTPYRNIVQSIISIIFDFPNLWKLSKGTSAASHYINSYGTHYRDYEHYNNCSLSKVLNSENELYFDVGAEPICINCGERHSVENNISCCVSKKICSHCGANVCEDDGHYIGDQFYCDDCATYCDDCGCYEPNDRVRYIQSVGRYVCDDCLSNYTYCDRCGQYYPNYATRYIDELGINICDNCYEEDDYVS